MRRPRVRWHRRLAWPRRNKVRFRFTLTAAALVVLAIGGCGPSRDARSSRPVPVFSPNGELLSRGGRGDESCPVAVGGWWERLAEEHQGKVDKDAFIADAKEQFAAMDLDHDGFITPYELSEYRSGADEQSTEKPLPPGATPQTQTAIPQSRNRRTSQMYDDSAIYPRATRTTVPADVVDPVMSADKALNFKVSLDDFLAQANELFAEMDKAKEGKISKEAAVALRCPLK
jgi:hypothetical protein